MSLTQLSPLQYQQYEQHVAYTPQQKLQLEAAQAAPWQTGSVSQEDRDKAAAVSELIARTLHYGSCVH